MQNWNISCHKLPDFCEDGLMLMIWGIICLLQAVCCLSAVCYFGCKRILKNMRLLWKMETCYQH